MKAKFEQFHAKNPGIYKRMVALTRAVKDTGRKHFSLIGVWSKMRVDLDMNTAEGSHDLNNEYRSHYARLIMEQEPDLVGFFRLRPLRSA
jgi:hypothetical protein